MADPPFDMPPASAGFDARGGWVVNRLMAEPGLGFTNIIHPGGVVGNLGGESGLQAVQEVHPISGRGGWGWEQATGDRRVNFEQFCDEKGFSINSDEANYDFLVKELLGSESHALRQLKKTTGLQEAVYTFEVLFERPSDPQGGLPSRVEFARRALAAATRAPNAHRPSPDPEIERLRIPPRPALRPAPPPEPSYPAPAPWLPAEPPPQPSAIIMPPAAPSVPLLSRLGALGIGSAATYLPAQTLVETTASILQAPWFTQKIQDDWVITLVLVGGLISHSAIAKALQSRVIRDLIGTTVP